MTKNHKRRAVGIRRALTVMLSAGAMAGCDLEVINPGPVNDSFLDDQAAFDAIINGVGRNMNWALNVVSADGGIRSREVHVTDVDDWNGMSYPAHVGWAVTDAPTYLSPWNHGQAARWIGEDFLRRAAENLDDPTFNSSRPVARGHLWTGFAHRLLAGYYCELVFDGGPAVPSSAGMERAEEVFTNAIQIGQAANASEVVTAAYAGRASVRVHLGDWAGAVADAAMVPTDFNFYLPYYADGEWRYYDSMAYTSSYTVWNTPYADYYLETGDPRTPWVLGDSPTQASSVEPWTVSGVPNYRQQKYTEWDDARRLAGGSEMRLIEAEAMLRDGDIAGAMAKINALRANVGVDPWPMPASLDAAYTILKRERGIELWLEGRRFADLRRWAENNTPGALAPEEMGGTNGGPDLSERVLCLPIPEAEKERNPNF